MARDQFVADDVISVRDRIAVAVARAREESLPTLIEIRTYRYRGHSMSDPGKYRTPEEVEAHRQQDALLRCARELQRLGESEAQLALLDTEVEAEVQDAVTFAEQSAEPGEDLIEAYTYA